MGLNGSSRPLNYFTTGKAENILDFPPAWHTNMKGRKKGQKTSSIQKQHRLLRAAVSLSADAGNVFCVSPSRTARRQPLQLGTCVLPSLTPKCEKQAQCCKNRERTATLVPNIAEAEKIPFILAFNFPRVWTLSERRWWERVRTRLCEMCGKFKKQSFKKKNKTQIFTIRTFYSKNKDFSLFKKCNLIYEIKI